MRAIVASTTGVRLRCAAVALAAAMGSGSAQAGPAPTVRTLERSESSDRNTTVRTLERSESSDRNTTVRTLERSESSDRNTTITEGSEAQAEARFREGSQAFDEGRVDEACLAFDESLHLLLTLGTLLNLALCHERQGKTATAWREFTHAAAWASDGAQRDRREFAHQHALRLERALSHVRIELPRDTPIDLEIDGESIVDARRPLPVFLDPGEHRITASAPARRRFESTVTVPAAGSSAVLVVRIPQLEEELAQQPVAAPPKELAAPSPNPRRAAGWIVGGVGVVSLGVGVYFGADSLSKMGTLVSSCPGSCDPAQARASETVSLVTLGAGAAAIASGAWILLTAPPASAPTTVRARVVPQVGAQSGGVSVIGTW